MIRETLRPHLLLVCTFLKHSSRVAYHVKIVTFLIKKFFFLVSCKKKSQKLATLDLGSTWHAAKQLDEMSRFPCCRRAFSFRPALYTKSSCDMYMIEILSQNATLPHHQGTCSSVWWHCQLSLLCREQGLGMLPKVLQCSEQPIQQRIVCYYLPIGIKLRSSLLGLATSNSGSFPSTLPDTKRYKESTTHLPCDKNSSVVLYPT